MQQGNYASAKPHLKSIIDSGKFSMQSDYAEIFMESNDNTREFPLAGIKISGNTFSFVIKNTTISFFGKINEQHSGFSGSFLLEGKTAVTVTHQKLDSAKIRNLKQQNSCIPKKEIDHTDGVFIG